MCPVQRQRALRQLHRTADELHHLLRHVPGPGAGGEGAGQDTDPGAGAGGEGAGQGTGKTFPSREKCDAQGMVLTDYEGPFMCTKKGDGWLLEIG